MQDQRITIPLELTQQVKNVDNVSVAAFSASSEMTELGINVGVSLGAVTPFIDVAYVNEDTTSASYKTELQSDEVAE